MSFKLPDFLEPGPLESMRRQMGAPLAEAHGPVEVPSIELPILTQLIGAGVDVKLEEVEVLSDHTLAYKGHRVLLYIRDVRQYGERQSMPRFHMAFCRTLDQMRADRRFERYVVASRDDGLFVVNLIGDATRSDVMRLDVCQNCLATLSWQGFTFDLPRDDRRSRVERFKLVEYFAKYPRDLISVQPEYDSDTAPLNDYPPNWPQISARFKKEKRYKCNRCNVQLSDAMANRYLHVHHINGRKDDCRDANLEALCIRCHAEEPRHQHMKADPNYQEFMDKFGSGRWFVDRVGSGR